jgi:hypothetical protein
MLFVTKRTSGTVQVPCLVAKKTFGTLPEPPLVFDFVNVLQKGQD